MPKQNAKRKTAHNVKMLSKAGKAPGAKSGKAPQRPAGQLGGKRKGISRTGKAGMNS